MTSASVRFRNIFGQMRHLKEDINWTNGLSSLAEFLAWNPQYLIGLSKKKFIEKIVSITLETESQGRDIDEITTLVKNRLEAEMKINEQQDAYSKKTTGISNAREAVRRLTYFSEDYLNKEFDIFLTLASDNYIDSLYGIFNDFDKGNHWTVIGNSHLYEFSVNIDQMAMDNLAYNHESKLLIANELKLNGGKNKDQILKYAYMQKALIEKGFIDSQTHLVLLFISGKNEKYEKDSLVNAEIAYCQGKISKFAYLLDDSILNYARNMKICNLSWHNLILFNENFLHNNDLSQVERKLINGFNNSLMKKSFMHFANNKKDEP